MGHSGGIHHENPFVDPPEARDPARRTRGRLVAPVTVWTAGFGEKKTGLTVSSLLVADGNPPMVLGLVKDTADFFEEVRESGTFVVHILGEAHKQLADRFAGLRPSPGGLFAGEPHTDSDWGPVLTSVPDRIYCLQSDELAAGYHRLIRARIEKAELSDLDDPLAYFRGAYRHLFAGEREAH